MATAAAVPVEHQTNVPAESMDEDDTGVVEEEVPIHRANAFPRSNLIDFEASLKHDNTDAKALDLLGQSMELQCLTAKEMGIDPDKIIDVVRKVLGSLEHSLLPPDGSRYVTPQLPDW